MAGKVTVVVGIAGSGKTFWAIDTIERYLMNGMKWNEIGFSSFSRQACLVAAERAAKLTGEDVDRMQKTGWFRTLHSAALRCLGVDPKCILDHESAEGKKFLTEALGGCRGGERGTLGDKISSALSIWDLCRARLALLQDADKRDFSVSSRKTCNLSCENCCLLLGKSERQTETTDATHTESCILTCLSPNVLPHICRDRTAIPYHIGDSNLEISEDSMRQKYECLSSDGKNALLYREIAKTDYNNCICHHMGRLSGFDKNPAFISGQTMMQGHEELILRYERHKKMYGRLDFTDILMSYVGIRATDELTFVQEYPNGVVPEEVAVWMVDEMQDSSPLLACVAERLSEAAGEVFYLGDKYQTVYGFSGALSAIFGALEDQAKTEGNSVLLNRSWRNPAEVLEWGEQVLREDGQYDERNPTSETGEGSVGLLDLQDFWAMLPKIANTDSMILCRTWHGLNDVKRRLDELTVPWRSGNEKASSRWEAPGKIAYTLVMRELMAGDKISEQDWRRVTETLPQKWDGKELFTRGTKAKWKKTECRREPERTLNEVVGWGATEVFAEFVRQGKWRTDSPLLFDLAITKYGVDAVRNPSVQLGTVHSFKGGEARNVFCLSASTGRVESEADPMEELCCKYVAITRASKHYRLIVDKMDIARGRPQFWAAPKGCNDWKGFDDFERVSNSNQSSEVVPWEEGYLDSQISGGDLREEGNSGSPALREREISGHRDEGSERPVDSDAGTDEDPTDISWSSL